MSGGRGLQEEEEVERRDYFARMVKISENKGECRGRGLGSTN